MSEVKEKILTEAETLFMRYGFKSITMDDVARELGVSKKTLYQFFADKNDLVNQCVEHYLERINHMCQVILDNKELDPINMLLQITEEMSLIIRQVNPSSMFDLKKYFKPAWDKLEVDRRTFIYNSMYDNMVIGIKKGLYRKELDPEMVTRIYIYLIGLLTDPDSHDHASLDIRATHLEIVKYHLRSICTSKGLELLEEKLKHMKK